MYIVNEYASAKETHRKEKDKKIDARACDTQTSVSR